MKLNFAYFLQNISLTLGKCLLYKACFYKRNIEISSFILEGNEAIFKEIIIFTQRNKIFTCVPSVNNWNILTLKFTFI